MENEKRLTLLGLPSLEFRRFRGDLIEMYKITHNLYDPKTTSTLFSYSENHQGLRQHDYKVYKMHTNKHQYKNFFTNRISNCWNKLPIYIVNSSSLNIFKNEIDRYFKDHMFSTNLSNLY